VNPRLAAIEPSLIRAIAAGKRPGDIDLGMGEPTLRPDPAPFEVATAWVRENGCPYTPNAGDPELRASIAAHHGYRGLDTAANVCVTVGSEEALFLAIKTVLDPARDEVLVVEPSYLAYAKICAMEGIAHRSVALAPEQSFRPDAAAVLASLRPETRMVVLASPNNPTGRVWPASEMHALAEGLAASPGPPVYLLADEVYRELYFGDDPPAAAAAYHPHTLVVGSLSKSCALTGLRLGWLMGPADAVELATRAHQLVNTAASTFSQRVALEMFAAPGAIAAQRPAYAARRRTLMGLLLDGGIAHAPVEGAFYAFLRLPPALAGDSLRAAELLLEHERIVTVPGRAFGAAGEGWLRISWVAAEDALRDGVERIARFFAAAR
jgi:aspartate/methionine/tyrosine aminotransferase